MQAAAPTSATWVPVGPMGAPTGLVGGFARKAGRDNFLTFMPSNTLTIFAGAAGGGQARRPLHGRRRRPGAPALQQRPAQGE